jgi:hypothetical protein
MTFAAAFNSLTITERSSCQFPKAIKISASEITAAPWKNFLIISWVFIFAGVHTHVTLVETTQQKGNRYAEK